MLDAEEEAEARGERGADNGSVLANLPATVISFHAKRTWIIQP